MDLYWLLSSDSSLYGLKLCCCEFMGRRDFVGITIVSCDVLYICICPFHVRCPFEFSHGCFEGDSLSLSQYL